MSYGFMQECWFFGQWEGTESGLLAVRLTAHWNGGVRAVERGRPSTDCFVDLVFSTETYSGMFLSLLRAAVEASSSPIGPLFRYYWAGGGGGGRGLGSSGQKQTASKAEKSYAESCSL